MWVVAPSLVAWHLWKDRNRRIFREEVMEVVALIEKMKGAIEETDNGIASNNIEEILALEEGLRWVTKHGILKVIIEGDSLIILNGVNKSAFTDWIEFKDSKD
ncbi:hypothetical protein SUGI_0829300 [Cryptomeria japonica]|nr:hypothetical protein SUGI_0829300 [Cryptomeria japonica]